MTDWSGHDTASMWRMVSNQDTSAHWRHVAGLRKIVELTATHLARLHTYRDNLAAAWAPSPASAAFLGRLDYLITHVQATHNVAAANYGTLAAATATLQSARTSMGALHTEWTAARAQVVAYDEAVAFQRASQLPGTSMGPPPVTEAELERINVRARAVMADLSTTLVQAQTQLQHPTPYEPGVLIDTAKSYVGINTGPRVPAVMPRSAPADTSWLPGSKWPSTEASPDGRSRGTAPPGHEPRPRAGGVIPTPQISPTMRRLATQQPSETRPASVPRPRSLPFGGLIGAPPGVGLLHANSSPASKVNPIGGLIENSADGRPSSLAGPPTAVPGTATGRPGSPIDGTAHRSTHGPLIAPPGVTPVAAARQSASVPTNSNNHVTTPRRTTTPSPFSTGMAGAPPGVTEVRRTTRSPLEGTGARWDDQPGRRQRTLEDSDDFWATPVGVEPVILPPRESGPVDPGPAIGLDR